MTRDRQVRRIEEAVRNTKIAAKESIAADTRERHHVGTRFTYPG